MFHKQGAPLSLVLWAGRPFPEILWARDISTLILQEQGTPLSRDPMGEGYPLPKILWPGDLLSRNSISKGRLSPESLRL